jgi:Mrp family chromosome partitioning ATPase
LKMTRPLGYPRKIADGPAKSDVERMSRRFLVEPDSASAEPFRTLRLALETRLRTTNTKGLVFTSPRSRDGRSTIAANYAVVAAFVQRPVLLIDADMRNPSMHEMFGLPRSPGLVDALREELAPWEVVHTFPSLGGLHVMTAGTPLARTADVAASPAMAELLQRAFEEWEAVVIDSPPTLVAADASGLASLPGTAIVMVVHRSGKRRHVVGALRKLALMEANVLGLVVNQERPLTADLY